MKRIGRCLKQYHCFGWSEEVEDRKWEVFVDKPFPESILVSALRPDLVLVDEGQRRVILGELTVPWEEIIAEAHERKLLGYEELVAEIREKDYICELVAFENLKLIRL
ncbi:Hypothetical predicted protein [Octopus vulgaris]|uniref:Uncharacterized protein n=1 Tax=Octopus vulgaris TaxID=6645 RepID=A0AA36B911_OCTVU|nr:Hypothetical predicted protein [Octopus vulgaris]